MSAIPASVEGKKAAMHSRLTSVSVHVPDPNSVWNYLDDHLDLTDLLAEICDAVRAEFGPVAELSLELYTDREIDERYLSVYVRCARYGTDIMTRLDRVAQPFAERLERVTGDLLLTTDFRPPRGMNAV